MDLPAIPFQHILTVEGEIRREDEIGAGEGFTRCLPCDNRDRPVFIGIASGGVFTGDKANQPDFLTPYLSLALGSIGLKTVQFLPVQATGFLDRDQATLAREKALAAIDLTVMGEVS
jgi:hypothetical protein